MSELQNKKALKAGAWYIVGNFLLKSIGLLTTPVFSRLMSKEDIGKFSDLLTWVGIISIILTLDLYSSISLARFDYKDKLDEYISSILGLGSLITIIFFIIIFPIKEVILHYLGFSEYLYYLIFLYMLFYPAIQIFQSKCQVQYRYKPSLIISLSTAFSSSVISLSLVFFWNNKILARVIGFFTPFILIGAMIYLYYMSRNFVKTRYWKYALSISIPLSIHLLASYILNTGDRVMIHSFDGDEAVGVYSIGYSCAMLINVLMTSLNSAWAPWSMEQVDCGNFGELRTKTRIYILMFGILALGIILLGPEILLIMGGKPYMEAKGIIPPVMVGLIFQFMYTLYVNIEQYYKKQKIVAIGTVVAACTNVVLNAIFIPSYGYVAAAYTTLFSYAVLFCVHFWFVNKIQRGYIYDSRFNIRFLLISLIVLVFSLVLYKYNVVRLFFVTIGGILVAICAIRNRRTLLEAIKTKSLDKVLNALNEMKFINDNP